MVLDIDNIENDMRYSTNNETIRILLQLDEDQPIMIENQKES